ncbi:hypothetical protein GCM10025866_23680 [Naasia aerilata]|uniref:Uncharacterized protein n=1 Tax=Naasia aerilata TaxID=1162966 RepID=A0ABM8GDT7_9MICO|nr:hypothetical protein GCM10025866_23680 [Naasia aerilata]
MLRILEDRPDPREQLAGRPPDRGGRRPRGKHWSGDYLAAERPEQPRQGQGEGALAGAVGTRDGERRSCRDSHRLLEGENGPALPPDREPLAAQEHLPLRSRSTSGEVGRSPGIHTP